jgi:hypothetical protein
MLDDNTQYDSAICYYAFINHGTLPHEILECTPRERAFIYAMIKKEIKSRDSSFKKQRR